MTYILYITQSCRKEKNMSVNHTGIISINCTKYDDIAASLNALNMNFKGS